MQRVPIAPSDIVVTASTSETGHAPIALLSESGGFWQSDGSGTHVLTIGFGGASTANCISVCDQNDEDKSYSPRTVSVCVKLASGGEVNSRVTLTPTATRTWMTLHDGAAITHCVITMESKDRDGVNVRLHGLRAMRGM